MTANRQLVACAGRAVISIRDHELEIETLRTPPESPVTSASRSFDVAVVAVVAV
ncbi:hypothetical protein ACFXC8_11815 [Streptomyces sp. NPDC059441]|uniref:hypothetical protein n=1 Tax=Streptomyces sp. NPDC059441 TaxID=3346829 RepID=UPI0036A10ABF